MKFTFLLFLYPLVTTAYNLDVAHAIIYSAPYLSNEQNRSSGYFGYSVSLASQKLIFKGSDVHKSWLLVGAPRANYTTNPNHGKNKIPMEPGIMYRCHLPNKCIPINLKNPDNENGFIVQVQQHIQIEKEYGWLGAAISLDEATGLLTVCAPRTIIRLFNSPGMYFETMQGVCYNGSLELDNLQIIDKNFTTHSFSSLLQYSSLNGFSVHYPKSKETISSISIQPIIGSPKHEIFGSVRKIRGNKIAELPIQHSLAQFGYALTSGYYFDEMQLLIVAGAPGWQYVGQVAILESNPNSLIISVTIEGKEIGEYFGASLATGDINNDGLDDLIVGAPHWKNDNGRVHIFLGNKDGFRESQILLLEGNVDDALYGYAVTSGDLDGDGFDDIIVGAPWEDSGVIYVYNGAAKLAELQLLKPSQRIAASAIRKGILRFGFSLSKLVDIDGDRMLDVAVGAYASEHVVILRSKPAVETRITLSTDPKVLLRNSTSFMWTGCLDYSYPRIKDKIEKLESIMTLKVDMGYHRVVTASIDKIRFFREPSRCKGFRIKLLTNITNRVDVIKIVGYHQFYYLPNFDKCAKPGEMKMDSLCPTAYKALNETAETVIPFHIGCGMDDICHSSIFTKQYFQNTRNSTWIIGSDDLTLVLEIGNFGEAAYLTTVEFDIPRGVHLKSILPSCKEKEDTGLLKVTCDVGNPLEKQMKSISLDLDMEDINNGSANGTTLIFSAVIETLSVNIGVTAITIPLHLEANVSISLNGVPHDDSYEFESNEGLKNFTFQHIYQITRFGVTPIAALVLSIEIPYKLDGLEFLSLLNEPLVSVSGRIYECHSFGVSVRKPQSDDELPLKRKYIMSHTIPTNSIQWTGDKNTQSQFYNKWNSENIDVTYLNCSTNNVVCGKIVCNVFSLNTDRDVGNLGLQLIVTDRGLSGGTVVKEKVIHITTRASVTVQDTEMQFKVPGSGTIVPVTTTIRFSPNDRAPNVPGISIWMILGSVTWGLVILCLSTIVLWKFNFFKRTKKEELETLKNRENIPLCPELICEQLDD